MDDQDISRLILKLLIQSGLEEQFVSIRGGANKNVVVYLGIGKKFQNVLSGKLQVRMATGLKPGTLP